MKLLCIAAVLFIATVTNCDQVSDDDLDKLVNYVANYINFTTYYKLPTNNSEISYVSDSKVHEYGDFDFIIIGAGSSGTILPRRLTENPNFRVLLLEAGKDEDNFTNIPAMNAFTRNTPYNWGYYTVPQKNSCLGMVDQKCVFPIGKGLGGSNIIGDMVYTRGNKADFDDWAAQGNVGWSYKDVLPYFKKTERDETNDTLHTAEYHGYKGILHINYTYPWVMNYNQYRAASLAVGLKEVDINGPTQSGFQQIPWTIKGNVRQTGGNAFIKPVINRKNLNVTLEAFVTKLIIEGKTVTGVQFVKGNKTYVARPKKEVILAAGVINSPQILMLSGIGPEEELKKHNIPVRVNLPAVGKNLTDQPVYIGLYVRTNQTSPALTIPELLALYVQNKRPFNSIFNAQHISFVNTKTRKDPPNVEIITINPPTSVPGDLVGFYNLNNQSLTGFAEFNTLTDYLVYVFVTKPKSRGTVTLKSNSHLDFPLIDPAYLSDKDDLQTLYEGIQFVLNMTNTASLKSINATVVSNSPQCEHLRAKSEKRYWYCAIKHLTSPIYHPTGTTKMGVSPKYSVVNNEFKVHGMTNLRVCDAGAMPSTINGHPFAATMMMGEKLADIIKKQYA